MKYCMRRWVKEQVRIKFWCSFIQERKPLRQPSNWRRLPLLRMKCQSFSEMNLSHVKSSKKFYQRTRCVLLILGNYLSMGLLCIMLDYVVQIEIWLSSFLLINISRSWCPHRHSHGESIYQPTQLSSEAHKSTLQSRDVGWSYRPKTFYRWWAEQEDLATTLREKESSSLRIRNLSSTYPSWTCNFQLKVNSYLNWPINSTPKLRWDQWTPWNRLQVGLDIHISMLECSEILPYIKLMKLSSQLTPS